MEQLRLKELDPKTLRDSCLLVCIATKGSGMTTTMRDFIYKQRLITGGGAGSDGGG
jgi:hypothetical protein